MARKRRKTGRRTTRRRVSGIGGDGLQVAAGVVLGAIGGRFISAKAAAMTKPVDPKIVAVVQLIGGAVIAKKMRNPLVKGIGLGLVAAGGTGAAQSFGVISGFSNFRSLQAINGLKRINGLSDQINGVGRRMNGATTPFNMPGRKASASVINGVNGHASGAAGGGANGGS